jgi:hypothetical protein
VALTFAHQYAGLNEPTVQAGAADAGVAGSATRTAASIVSTVSVVRTTLMATIL